MVKPCKILQVSLPTLLHLDKHRILNTDAAQKNEKPLCPSIVGVESSYRQRIVPLILQSAVYPSTSRCDYADTEDWAIGDQLMIYQSSI